MVFVVCPPAQLQMSYSSLFLGGNNSFSKCLMNISNVLICKLANIHILLSKMLSTSSSKEDILCGEKNKR